MITQSSKYFYTADSWDEAAWLDIVSIEYESLLAAYPFDTRLREIPGEGRLKVLDVGCGSAIFAQYLDKTLGDDLHLSCDLLDVSDISLQQARGVLRKLKHFSPSRLFKTLIEDLPSALHLSESTYDAIWAIHSLTTVDLERMPEVFRHLLRLLSPGGRLYIYQLTADSSYQTLHQVYRQQVSPDVPRFMEFEDTKRILDSLPVEYKVIELSFDHELPRDRPELVENYLRKCVLDDTLDTEQVFGDLLSRFKSDDGYRIPQSVNFISVSKR
ncbi:MAG: class I SAM-dependent methyltransferase [Chloroflexi bacterium]|nr:class I SAM-dependent methyltransferase [Chloroflexota bacterium]